MADEEAALNALEHIHISFTPHPRHENAHLHLNRLYAGYFPGIEDLFDHGQGANLNTRVGIRDVVVREIQEGFIDDMIMPVVHGDTTRADVSNIILPATISVRLAGQHTGRLTIDNPIAAIINAAAANRQPRVVEGLF